MEKKLKLEKVGGLKAQTKTNRLSKRSVSKVIDTNTKTPLKECLNLELLELKLALKNKKKFFLEHRKVLEKVLSKITSKRVKAGLLLFFYRVLNQKIVNGVAPITLYQFIDLQKLAQFCESHSFKYKKYTKFTGVPVKYEDKTGLKFTAVFFKTGKINLVGLQDDSPAHLDRICKILKVFEAPLFEGRPIFDVSNIRFANRVLSVKIPKLLNVSKLNYFNKVSYWRNIKYHSEAFPGAVFKFTEHQAKVIVFKTGSTIFTGITSKACLRDIATQFIQVLTEFITVQNSKAEEI